MGPSELERIERRLEQTEKYVQDVALGQAVILNQQERILHQQRYIISLLEAPTTYPASTGGTISVK